LIVEDSSITGKTLERGVKPEISMSKRGVEGVEGGVVPSGNSEISVFAEDDDGNDHDSDREESGMLLLRCKGFGM